MKKRVTALLCVFTLAVTALAGCGKQSNDKKDGNSESKKSDSGIVCYVGNGFWDGPLDPTKGFLSYGWGFINEPLICVNENSQYEADLATEWEVSEDALTYTFKLREGVKFHDGSDFTAEDVVFTFETVKKNQADNEDVDLSLLDKAEAVDDYTVKFTLKEPNSTFFDGVAQLGIVPSDAYDEKTFGDAPIGTGAWKFLQLDTDQQLIVEANEDYFDGAPEIKKVTFVSMDNEAAFSNAKSGQLDIVMVQPSYTTEEIEGMHIEKLETMDVRNISLPCREPGTAKDEDGKEVEVGNAVTSDIAVRKALNIGIDREKIIQDAFNGVGKPAEGFTSNLEWGNTKEYEDGQVEEAKKLLEDAGWVDSDEDGIREKDGVKCEFTVYTPTDEQDRYQLSMAVAKDVEKLGIRINVNQTTWDEIAEKGNTGGVLWGWGQFNPMVIRQLFATDSFLTGLGSGASGYSNAEVDQYIENAILADNHEEAIQNWKMAQEVYGEEYPYLYIVNIEHCYFVSDRLDISEESQSPHPHGHGIPIICNMKDWKLK